MNKQLIITNLLFLFSFFGKADVPSFDVAKLKIGDEIVFMKFETRGILKDGDMCYYNYQGEYVGEARQKIYELLSISLNYEFYSELHKINITNVPDLWEKGFLFVLFVLKKQIKFESDINIDSVVVLSVENGNTYGYIYSVDLSERDNTWMTKFKIVKLFDIDAFDICHMSLFAIEGAVSNARKIKLQQLLNEALKEGKERFEKELSQLHKQKTIMIGFCSC